MSPTPTKPTTTPTPDKSTTNDTEEVKTSKTEKWFSTKRNKGFSQGLSFSQDLSSSQVPQIFIITDFSNESLDLGVKLLISIHNIFTAINVFNQSIG
jgi:hypothetical protein